MANDQLVIDTLKQHWGFDKLRPLQHEAIQSVMTARDSLVVMPTGGGKSLCFQLPALCQTGLAIVVSPLISLMKDQVDSLRSVGIHAAAINSSLSTAERRSVADAIQDGKLKLLYVAPERLLMESTLEFLSNQTVGFVAIDEAHCISSWGHDFRPEYRGLRRLKEVFHNIPIHAFTATATPHVRDDIVNQLGLIDPTVLVGDFLRKNLVYHTARRENGLNQICSVIDRYRGQSGIVYCISRAEVEKTSLWLNQMGYRSLPYHAGMSDTQRTANQDAFITEQVDTIVATVAFGMGIDKSNVRYVVHSEMPKSIEHYQQESGRAGRDGLGSECWLFYSSNDLRTWKALVENGSPESQAASLSALDRMYAYCTSVECRHRSLLSHFGQSLTEPCEACDVCLGTLESVAEPLIVAQKILSCVVRVKERFGADHVSKVLAGADTAKIAQFEHNQLSTWGILKEHRRTEVRDWIEQLVNQNFLCKTGEFQLLQVTPLGRQLLRGQGSPPLLKSNSKKPASTPSMIVDSWDGVDRGLFEHLRLLRRTCAEVASLPAYIVFADTTLRDLARRRPSSPMNLLAVHGVGRKKAEDYGATFIAAIVEYCQKNQLTTDIVGSESSRSADAEGIKNGASVYSFKMFDQGLKVEEVAQQLSRAQSTVVGYLEDYLRIRKITDASPWVAPTEIERIELAAQSCDQQRLKPIYDALHSTVDYSSIRIVLTCLKIRQLADSVGSER